jgi:hypothetical protein
MPMIRRIGAVTAVIALAAAAFTAAYFGGSLLTQADPVEPAGAALRAPQLAKTTAVAMVTPTASPTPTATRKPKKKHKRKRPKKVTTTTKRVAPVATPVATPVVTAVPTRAPVYRAPTQPQPQPKKKKKSGGIIIED